MLMYAQDYDEEFSPYDQGWKGGSYNVNPIVPGAPDFNWHATYGYRQTWCSNIYPYIKNVQVYDCPSRSGTVCMGVDYGVPVNGWNSTTPPVRVALYSRPRQADIRRPAEICMISEKYSGNPQYIMDHQYYMCDARHNGGGNIVFFDGHVKWMQFEDSSMVSYGFTTPVVGYSVHVPPEVLRDPFS